MTRSYMFVIVTLVGAIAMVLVALGTHTERAAALTFTVTNTSDSGAGSLRQALTNANANVGTDTIDFNIPSATDAGCNNVTGVCTISPASVLPFLNSPVIIDGLSQPGASPNTNPIASGSNAQLKIELEGSSIAGTESGLTIPTGVGGSTIRGLVINRFSAYGIRIHSDSNVIEGNYIGTDPTGTVALGNAWEGTRVNASHGNRIGGTGAGSRNLISGNAMFGVGIAETSTGNLVQGNYIGTDASGASALGNTQGGVRILHAGTLDNTVGGAATGASNVIAYNGGVGVLVDSSADDGNLISRNAIHSNAGLGIDLGGTGVTANDSLDADIGPNDLQNFPSLTSVSLGSTTVEGTLSSAPNSQYTVEFYYSSTCDGSGHGEGESFLGAAIVNTDGSGNVSFSPTFALTIPSTSYVTATATDANNSTSEFSSCTATIPKLPHPGDTDGDGCSDQQENGPNQAAGGRRNYLNPWDFYDTNGDQQIDLVNDITNVALLFGADADNDPPGEPDGYVAALDRSAPLPGADPWDMQAPDGVIDLVNDIFGVAFQFGHNCT